MNTVQPLRNKRDIAKMKKALAGNKRNLLLFTIGINTSLRISDILPLRAEQFNGEYLTLVERKTGKTKRIRLNKSVIDAVQSLASPTGLLFPSRTGDKAISRVQAWRVLNAAAQRAGVSHEFGTHSLRKTFAYHAYKAGVDLALLQNVLNHSSQRETLRYIGITQDQIDDVYVNIAL